MLPLACRMLTMSYLLGNSHQAPPGGMFAGGMPKGEIAEGKESEISTCLHSSRGEETETR